MVARVFTSLGPPKIVLSKDGFDASSPSLPDANKVFDSDWFFNGQIIHMAIHTFTRDASVNAVPYWDLLFPQQNFLPCASVYSVTLASGRVSIGSHRDSMIFIQGQSGLHYRPTVIMNDRIRMPHGQLYLSSQPVTTRSFLSVVFGM